MDDTGDPGSGGEEVEEGSYSPIKPPCQHSSGRMEGMDNTDKELDRVRKK